MKLLHFVQRFVWKIFPTFAINKRVDSYIKNKYHDKIWGGYKLDEQIEENIHIFLTEKELEDKKFLESIKRDIVKSYLLYGVNANEYFTHNFYAITTQNLVQIFLHNYFFSLAFYFRVAP